MSPLDSPGKLYKHRYNCFLFWAGLFAFSILQRSSNYISFPHAKNKNKKYEKLLAPTDSFPLNKRCDSDWIILTARHATVEWVLHI